MRPAFVTLTLAASPLATDDVPTLRRQRRCDQAGVSDHHHNQGDGKRCRRHEVRKTVVNHAGTVAGAAIFSFSSVQVLRTSAVSNEQFSI